MSGFITEKQRQDIKDSIRSTRDILFKIETTMHLDSDDNILYHMNEEVKVRVDFIVQFMKTAQLYKSFEETKGRADFADNNL